MPVEISIVIPVFNEAGNIARVAEEVLAALGGQGRVIEVVFVDDGSGDATWERILEVGRRDARVRGVRHARNAGQSAAIWTGLRHTTGRVVATLDGDGQNDPRDLLGMLGMLGEVDFVCGERVRREDGWMRRVSSRVARVARRWVLGIDFADTGCALRVFRREAVEGVIRFDGWHRFLPVLVQAAGWRTREVPVQHRAREAGVSKYGVWNRLGRGLYDLVGVGWYVRRRLREVATTAPQRGDGGERSGG